MIKSKKQSVAWECPSNIALVKYWGKYGDQLAMNPSLSLTLNQAVTRTIFSWKEKTAEQKEWLELEVGGQPENGSFHKKIHSWLEKLSHAEMPELKKFQFIVKTQNTFPHSTGIASSASGFGALGLCLASFEQVLAGKVAYPVQERENKHFFERAGHLARLGSGSACRSMKGPLMLWGEGKWGEQNIGNQHFATEIQTSPTHWSAQVRDAILVADSSPKSVSSSIGHSLMNDHPYADLRFTQARNNLQQIFDAVLKNNWVQAGAIIEAEALSLHALMMSSSESFVLLKPNTLKLIEAIRKYRLETGVPIYFTLDAGPNVHLLYLEENAAAVKDWIKSSLLEFCENGHWIDDKVGPGPVPFEDYLAKEL